MNDEDLGISRCMGEKSRALFYPVSLRPTYQVQPSEVFVDMKYFMNEQV